MCSKNVCSILRCWKCRWRRDRYEVLTATESLSLPSNNKGSVANYQDENRITELTKSQEKHENIPLQAMKTTNKYGGAVGD